MVKEHVALKSIDNIHIAHITLQCSCFLCAKTCVHMYTIMMQEVKQEAWIGITVIANGTGDRFLQENSSGKVIENIQTWFCYKQTTG